MRLSHFKIDPDCLGLAPIGTILGKLRHGPRSSQFDRPNMESEMLYTIVIVVLVLMLVGSLPTWPHSAGWGYYPSGGIGTLLVIIVIVLLVGRR